MRLRDQITRRDFLKLAVNSLLGLSGALTFGGLARFFGYAADPPPPVEFDIGPASNYPPNTTAILSNIPAMLRHEGKGYSAFSLKCTHLGCTVEKKVDIFECPCHGSRFDNSGGLLRGPATRPLPELRVEEKDGNLIVYVG